MNFYFPVILIYVNFMTGLKGTDPGKHFSNNDMHEKPELFKNETEGKCIL